MTNPRPAATPDDERENISQNGRFQRFEGIEIDHGPGDRTVKLWFLLAVLWFAFFTTFGLILAVKFFWPTFIGDVSWFTFGVVRPSHVNGVLFGFLSSALLGGMFYIVPRLAARPLNRPGLAFWTPILWNASVFTGIIMILTGSSQGREYAELPWVIDVLVEIDLLVMAYIILSTLKNRREKKLYVSTWYYTGTMLWFPVVYFIGNVMWRPPEGALSGVRDAVFNWYYGHNVLGLWFTTLGIPALYYLLPKITKRPLYSHLLSLIGFFSIAFFYTGVGGHHLLQAPIPEWLKTMAVVWSMFMMVPVLAFATNIMLTLRDSWHKLPGNPALMFLVAGFFMYVIGSAQGSFQAFRSVNLYTHFSQWPVGHAHLTLLGGFGFTSAGLALWIVPRVLNFRLFSFQLMRYTWWTAFLGFIGFFSTMTITGLIQNANWFYHINVIETLATLRVPFITRAITGGFVVVAAYMVAVNIVMTFISARHPVPSEAFPSAEPVTSQPHSRFQRQSQEKMNLGIVISGGMAGFSVMTFMVVAMPYLFSYIQPSEDAHPLSANETLGQQLYKSNGCFYCHSQFVRPYDWAYGDLSQPGDYYYSIPNFMGTERTGPPLANIGGKRPTEWHFVHDRDARAVSPRSIMPPFAFLDDKQLAGLVEYIQNLGEQDLDPHAFQPEVPYEYRNSENPNTPLMMQVLANYDPNAETFSGPDNVGSDWSAIFNEGKALFTQKCLPCHSCAGNGQGPYAREALAHPANLHERISNFPAPQDAYHNWRVHEGVPGTLMPPWGWTLDDETISKINTYEMSFVNGAVRTIPGNVSDDEGDQFNNQTHILPPIAGTAGEFTRGGQLFNLYCAVCHGSNGKGDGPASIQSPDGYIKPVPANFTESGSDFQNYGRWVWKAREGVETTNMPPWKEALSDTEIFQIIYYIQGFSVADDYNSKWAPLYSDPFAKNLKR